MKGSQRGKRFTQCFWPERPMREGGAPGILLAWTTGRRDLDSIAIIVSLEREAFGVLFLFTLGTINLPWFSAASWLHCTWPFRAFSAIDSRFGPTNSRYIGSPSVNLQIFEWLRLSPSRISRAEPSFADPGSTMYYTESALGTSLTLEAHHACMREISQILNAHLQCFHVGQNFIVVKLWSKLIFRNFIQERVFSQSVKQ